MTVAVSQSAGVRHATWTYLAREAALFLGLSYVLLLGGTFNGLVLYRLNAVSTVLIGAVGAAWLARRWRSRRPAPRTALDWPLLALIGAYAAASAASADPRRSVGALLLLALYALVYYLAVDLLRAGWPAELLVKVVLLVSSFVLFFGLWEIERWYAAWLAIPGSGMTLPPATLRVRAFLGHPNFVAAFFTLLLPLGITRGLAARRTGPRLLAALWVMLAVVVVFFTSSRGGWLGTATALITLAVLLGGASRPVVERAAQWLRRRPLVLATAGIALAVALSAGGAALLRQVQHPTHGDRSGIWRVAGEMFARHPLLGNGPATYGTEFIAEYSVPPYLLLAHAHSFPLNVLAETGLLGFAALVALVVTALRLAWRRWHMAAPGERVGLAGPLAALAGSSVASLLDTPQTFPAIAVSMVLLVAIVAAGPGAPVDGDQSSRRGRDWPASFRLSARLRDQLVTGTLAAGWLLVTGGLAWSLAAYAPMSAGVLSGNLGRWSEAAGLLDEAAARDPGVAFYWLQAGFAHGRLALAPDGSVADATHLSAALQRFERGMALEPAYATNWANLAVLRWAAGDRPGALEAMQLAADRAWAQPAFRLGLGRMQEAAGLADQARATYRAALDSAPAWAESYYFRASPLRQSVRDEWALENPGAAFGAEAQLAAGWQALAEGHLDFAERAFNAARELNAAEPYLGLGRVYLAQGRQADAERALLTADFVGGPGDLAIQIQSALGDSAAARGEFAGAAARYQRATDLMDATTSFGVGRLGTAEYGWYVFNRESILADLLPVIPYPIFTDGMVETMLALGAAREALGQTEAAASAYCRALQAAPDNARAKGGCPR